MSRVMIFIAILGIGGALWYQRSASQEQSNTTAIHTAAAKFIGTLEEAQKSKTVLDYKSDQRVKWHFIPMETRKGLPVMEMSDAQRESAYALLRSLLSQAGYDKSRKIMSLENVLRQLEGPKSHERRNPLKYYFTLFGTPAAEGTWGVSIEGHHLSLNFVLESGKIVDSTPQFFASNPGQLRDSYGDDFPKGLQVLKPEEEIAFELVRSLSDEQKKQAIAAEKAPPEIRWAGEPQPKKEDLKSIPWSKLDEAQRAKLIQLIHVYSDSMRSEVSRSRWNLINEAGYDKLSFSWSGATTPGIGHYYVVQGTTFMIEFVNNQADAAGNPANHVHCVWRDLQGDFNLAIGG